MPRKTKRGINHLYPLRKNRTYEQKHLALLLGCSRAMVSQYERGVHLPSLRTAILMELVLGARLSEIYVDLYDELRHVALKRAGRLAPRLSGHIRGRILGDDTP